MRILEIAPEFSSGGIENILFNYFQDKNLLHDITIDFLSQKKSGIIKEKLEAAGYTVYSIVPKKKNIIKYLSSLNNVLKNGNYDIVHIHQSQMSFLPAIVAMLNNVKIRIAHVHTSNISSGFVMRLLFPIFSKLTAIFCTHYWACGIKAGKWLFNNLPVFYMKNAIQLDKFVVDKEKEKLLKETLSIKEDQIVICNIGRFDIPKNHGYIIELLSKLRDKGVNFVCILLGDGPLFDKYQNEVQDKNLENYVKFIGSVSNVIDYLTCVDISILPSLWEGLPVTCIETQAMGIITLISNNVTKEVCITDLCKQINLANMETWVDEISNFNRIKNSNIDAYKTKLQQAGYDLKIERNKILNEYAKYYQIITVK